MIKNINVCDLVRSREFVREPVDDICKKIENNSSKKIILNGGRGVGKSIVLANSELHGLSRIDLLHRKKCINMQFDAGGLGLEIFDEALSIHHCELLLSGKLLDYLRKYYSLTYHQKGFEDYYKMYKRFIDEFIDYVKNFRYDDSVKISKLLKPGELSDEILKEMKYYLDFYSCILAIDRFDWTNNGSKLSQEVLSKYFDMPDNSGVFDMFDKVIITTDDESLNDGIRVKELTNKGYSFIDVDYGRNIDVVREIIRKRVLKYNNSVGTSAKKFPFDSITDEILKSLINETNGNISMMLKSLNEVNTSYQWDEKGFDIEKEFELAIEEQLSHAIQLEEMGKPKRLYL